MKAKQLVSIFMFLFFTMFVVSAQDSEDDIFSQDQFDSTVNQNVEKEKENKLEYLPGGTLILNSIFVSLNEFSEYLLSGRLYGKVFLKITQPDIGSIYISSNISSYLFQGTNSENPGITAQGEELSEIDMTLSEFYISFDILKTVFLRVGKQLAAWGPAFFWTPGDFINLQKNDALQSLDLREGKSMLKLHVPVGGKMNFFGFADFSKTVTQIPSGFSMQDFIDKTNVALRMDFTALGFEYGVAGFWGIEKDQQYGIDAVGSLFGWDVYTELGITLPSEIDSTSWGIASGLQREFGELKKWSVQTEFFYNSKGFDETPDYTMLLISGGYNPFYMGTYYLYVGAGRNQLFNDRLTVSASCITNLSDMSFLPRLSFAFAFPQMPPLSLDISCAMGGDGKEFTFLNGDNSISVNLSGSITF